MKRRYFLGGILLSIFFINFSTLLKGDQLIGYDSTYVLAVHQKFVIPEEVQNGDYVGYWLRNYTWLKGKGSSTKELLTNFNGAFTINPNNGLISISDFTKINGKINQQDTIINLLVKTTCNITGISEIDTAQIRVKESQYCRFIDYSYSGTMTGSRSQPFNDLDAAAISNGYGYFIKRNNVIINEYTPLESLRANKDNPIVIAAYGIGNKPVFVGNTTGNNICFYVGDISGGSGDPDLTRSEYIYFYDIYVRNYNNAAFYVRRTSKNVSWYNVSITNCDKNDAESTLAINTSSYSDSSLTYPIELINCYFDTTSINCTSGCEKNFIKCGVGPAKIENCYFGRITGIGGGQSLRLTNGNNSHVKHCLFNSEINSTNESVCNIQIRQDKVIIEDCILNNMANGIFVTSPGAIDEIQPDSLTVKNCLFNNQGEAAIKIRPSESSNNPGYGHIIENNLVENAANGILLRDCINPVIQIQSIR